MCPAVMLANRRTQRAKGLVNIPTISTGIMIGSSQKGMPWGRRFLKWPTSPCSRTPPSWIIKNASPASPAVTLMFDVAVAPYGTSPSMLQNRMNVNVLSRYGTYRSP